MQSTQQPPRLARWLLKHFGSSSDNEALLGDLAEQYVEKGRPAWYWRQAIGAILVDFFKEIRGNKWLAARGLLTGWAVSIVFNKTVVPGLVDMFFYGPWATSPITAEFRNLYPFISSAPLPFLTGMLSGWLVGRLHRSHQTPVVLLFAGSILLVYLRLLGGFVLYVRPGYGYGVLVPIILSAATSLMGILVGGGLLRDKSNTVAN
jgi:hypothetical protein